MLWTQDVRPKVIEELGNLSMADKAKELGKRWASIEVVQKEEYEGRARQEKERYNIAMANYTPSQKYLRQKQGAALGQGSGKTSRATSAKPQEE